MLQTKENRAEDTMNRRTPFLLVTFLLVAVSSAISQVSPAERRSFREYSSPEELVSIAPSTPMNEALTALSEVSQKFIGKVIIDTERRSLPVNVDIQAKHWRDALELICYKNNLWYTEYDKYLQITSLGAQGVAAAGGTAGKNPPSFGSRELKISAVFFEVNLTKLEEVGFNWEFMKSTSNYDATLTFSGGDRVSSPIFEADITPQVSFANIELFAKVFSSYDLGEILSGPQIIVRSGEQGSIQVGQDFSIKERDFAGNLIDKFYHTGTIIDVTPTVIVEQGVSFVHMDVRVERSSVQPGTITTIINKTEAQTELLLLDGEETTIGGLYSNELSSIRTGIPFLKDLPPWFLGLRYLFGYDKDQVTKKELVILLKAELVPTLQERIAQKGPQDRIFERWLDEKHDQERRIKGGGTK
jgi:type IV pilus assembly protein PilQ